MIILIEQSAKRESKKYFGHDQEIEGNKSEKKNLFHIFLYLSKNLVFNLGHRSYKNKT